MFPVPQSESQSGLGAYRFLCTMRLISDAFLVNEILKSSFSPEIKITPLAPVDQALNQKAEDIKNSPDGLSYIIPP